MVNIFKPQKVLHLADELKKKNPKLAGEFMISTKLDGWLVAMQYTPLAGWSYPLSSRGRIIPSLKHLLTAAIKELPKPYSSVTLIGEVIIRDTPFHITNGILNRSVGDCLAYDAEIFFHDLIFSNLPNQTALARYEVLGIFLPKESDYFHRLELHSVAKYEDKLWRNIFQSLTDTGEEGIVAKRVDSIYSPGKRNSDLLKLKLESSFDCLAIRLEESIGEMGMDGLTLVSKRANGTEIRTIIGKHSDKKMFRENPDSVIGKVVTLKAMEEYQDHQLRQPVFSHIREDKLPHEID